MRIRILTAALIAGVLPGYVEAQICPASDHASASYCHPCDKKKMAHLYSEIYCTEQKIIRQHPIIFSRNGPELAVNAENGVKRTFRDEPDPDAPTRRGSPGYTIVAYFSKIGYASVRVDYSESFSYLFVNLHTGDSVDLDGVPVLSPNGSFIGVSRSDVVFNADAKLAVYSVHPDRLTKEFDTTDVGYTHGLERISKTLGTWGPHSIQWSSDTEFSFVAESLDCQMDKCAPGKPPAAYSFSRRTVGGKKQWWLK